jgi:dihydroxyacetone kinase phosphotransfer subunit
MISLILVSHCHQVAVGVLEIAQQMVHAPLPIAAVGGILSEAGDPQLGTDALRIAQAIREQWSEEGVLILVDLGSAVISTELALEMLPPAMSARCLISNAPLVEGAVIAALEASLQHDLETVNRAAEAVCSFQKVTR